MDNTVNFSDYEGEVDEDILQPPQLIICPFEEENNDEKHDPEEIKKIAFEIFKDSPDEFLVLESIYNGRLTKQIGLDLGLTKDEVHNIKRRIIRVLQAWVKRNNKPPKFSEPQPRRFSELQPPRFSEPQRFLSQ